METKQEEMQSRGQVTDRIKKKSVELLGYEISTKELRLMVHLHYILENGQRLKPSLLYSVDEEILAKWVEMGYILGGVTKRKGRPVISQGVTLKITKEFWDILCEIIWLGYVDLH